MTQSQKKIATWEERNVLNPTAVVKDNKVYLMYRSHNLNETSRIGMDISEDGLHITKMPAPVLYPDNDEMKLYEWNYKKDGKENENSKTCYFCYFDGIEDLRIVESENGDYIMTYTAYDGKMTRLCIASSKDLKIWVKHGLVFNNDKYKDMWSKSGAIVSELKDSKIIAKEISLLLPDKPCLITKNL